jgi:hypothetical protein
MLLFRIREAPKGSHGNATHVVVEGHEQSRVIHARLCRGQLWAMNSRACVKARLEEARQTRVGAARPALCA